MQRVGAIFIVVCMVLIAVSFGVVLFLIAGLTGSEATISALTLLMSLALYNAVTTRLRDRADLGAQIADLSRGTADLARQVAELGRRTAAIEGRGDSAAEKAAAATAPLASELSELGTLVKQLAESVASHETTLTTVKFGMAHAKPEVTAEYAPSLAAASEPGLPDAKGAASSASGSASLGREEMMTAIRSALDANRVDLYLQPIVTLPQRKVRYYEALTRLRTEDGRMLEPPEFLEPAETSGLVCRLDHLLLFRCVQVVRRLQLKNRDVGLFCNLSATTLNDPQFFPQMTDFMEANRAIAPSLVLEFKQNAWRQMGPIEQESLAALRQVGFRFSMDQVTDLRFEPRDLGERGIRFVKVPAALLLGRAPAPRSDIHAADLADLLNRFGISLIAERIENEGEVVDLLDFDLRFGQGFLFSPPRPVRAEALQAETAARNGEIARDGTPPVVPPAAAAR
jgi:cyclic-di-GMP phosphodiesterase TipF (flagellum assembly factor)